MKYLCIFLLLALLPCEKTRAQIPIPNTTPVTENFDGMGATLTLPTNWRVAGGTSPTWAGGTGSVTQQASSGSPTTGGTYNWGSTSSERAVGSMTSGSFASPRSVMSFYQNTGSTNITDLSISYDLERYRRNTAAASLQFHYSLDGTAWTAVTAGDVDAASLPTGSSIYGFNPPELTLNIGSFLITGLSIAPNANFYLRWNLNTTGSNSQGIGVDNVSITATFALPIELSSFTGKVKQNTTYLNWSTATEINNDYFSIERSRDGREFSEIGQVKGAGTSYEPQAYAFTDERPLHGQNYYRLRQVDFDGKFSYSPVVIATFGKASQMTLSPLPASENLRIQLTEPSKEDGRWQVFELGGRLMLSGEMLAETTEHNLNISELPEGAYALRLTIGQEASVGIFRKNAH